MMNILQVNTRDTAGGAANVAWNLHQAYRRRGHDAWLAVGSKLTEDRNVLPIPHTSSLGLWARAGYSIGSALHWSAERDRPPTLPERLVRIVAEPRHPLDWWRGIEDFNFPGTWRLLDLPPKRPEIVHCHNLHGHYFDLRALPEFSRKVPVVLTLHDAWMLSGHCAHSFDCERWRTGCGRCPDLTIYPSVRRDATAFNWQRKREIYSRSRLHVATPCRWLMQEVEESILARGISDARVIPNGVDLSIFHPANKDEVRGILGLPREAKILLFTANGIRANIFKDYQTMRAAVAQVAARFREESITLLALGEDAPPERIDGAWVRFVPYEEDPRAVARYYQASDAYVHGARAEVFSLSITEAMACGTPVVATSVGGTPEQVVEGRTGLLVPPADAEAMGEAIERLLADDELRRAYSATARKEAIERFDLMRQVDAYLSWYREIL